MCTVSPKPGSQSGLSLVELIVVCLVIGILAAIAVPIVFNQVRLHTLDTSVTVISNKVREARMDAIKRNRTSWVVLDHNARSAQVRSTDVNGNNIDVGYPQLFSQGVGMASSVTISFDSLGRLAAGSATSATFIGSGKQKTISVSAAGRVTVGPMS